MPGVGPGALGAAVDDEGHGVGLGGIVAQGLHDEGVGLGGLAVHGHGVHPEFLALVEAQFGGQGLIVRRGAGCLAGLEVQGVEVRWGGEAGGRHHGLVLGPGGAEGAQREALDMETGAEALESLAVPAEEVGVALLLASPYNFAALPLIIAEALVEGLGGAHDLARGPVHDPQFPCVRLEAGPALGAPGHELAVRRVAGRVVHGGVLGEFLRGAAGERHFIDLAVGAGGLGLLRCGFEGQGLAVRRPGVAVAGGDVRVVGHVGGEARGEIAWCGAAIGWHHEEVAHLPGILPRVPVAVGQRGVEAA